MRYEKRASPYSFKTHLNPIGDTVVTLVKGKHEVWLFNIGREGDIQLDVSVTDGEKKYKQLGLKTVVNEDGHLVPDISGLHIESLLVTRGLKEIKDHLERIFNV